MNKAWIVFGLILIISAEWVALSLFHDVEQNGYSFNNAVIAVAKWNYVDASVTISITPTVRNGIANATLLLPNGTLVSLTSASGFSQRFNFPRTGDFPGNGATSGPVPLSQDQPLNIVVTSEVSDVQSYLSSLSAGQTLPPVDHLNFVVYGAAQIFVSAYGVAL